MEAAILIMFNSFVYDKWEKGVEVLNFYIFFVLFYTVPLLLYSKLFCNALLFSCPKVFV